MKENIYISTILTTLTELVLNIFSSSGNLQARAFKMIIFMKRLLNAREFFTTKMEYISFV